MPHPTRHRRSAGFTLLEIMVVITLAAALMAVALPSLNRLRGETFRVELLRLQTYFRRVQATAISRKELLRVHYLPGTRVFQTESYQGNEFVALSERDHTFHFGPDGGELLLREARRDGRLLESDWTILQFPDGRRETTLLLVADASDRKRSVEIPGLFAGVRVK